MTRYRLIIGFALMLPLGSCQSVQQTEDRVVLAFGEAMFDGGTAGDSAGASVHGDTVLSRWSSPVAAGVVEGADAANVQLAKEAVFELGAVAGIRIDWRPAGDPATALRLHFTDKTEFTIHRAERAECYANTGVAVTGEIVEADIYVSRSRLGGWNTDCLAHELLHAFGWLGHTHRLRSANSYVHGETDLTEWDRILMHTLYDPRLERGSVKAEAMPVARVIIAELLAGRQ